MNLYLSSYFEDSVDTEHEIIRFYEEILNGKKPRFPNGIWEKPDAFFWANMLIRYVFEEKMHLTVNDLKTLNFRETLVKYKLSGMYGKVYNSSPYFLVESVYGRLFNEWEMRSVPNGFWEVEENRVRAVKWLVEDVLKAFTNEEVRGKLRVRVIRKYGLSGILTNIHGDDIFEFFNEAYPNRMKRWELRQVGHNYWKDTNNVRVALEWLCQELDVTKEWLKDNISYTLLEKYNLTGLIAEFDYNYERLLE